MNSSSSYSRGLSSTLSAPQVTVRVSGPEGWEYDPRTHCFDLVDARGRLWRRFLSPDLRARPDPRPRAEHLALWGLAPAAPFPAGVPWAALERTAGGKMSQAWSGSLQFYPDEKELRRPLKLILVNFQRKRVTLPFELRDLPLP